MKLYPYFTGLFGPCLRLIGQKELRAHAISVTATNEQFRHIYEAVYAGITDSLDDIKYRQVDNIKIITEILGKFLLTL